MSFQDLESGPRVMTFHGPALKHNEYAPSTSVVAAVFRINTAVAGYKRLVYSIGTPKDTHELRHKIRRTRLEIGQMVRETSALLDHIREIDKFTKVDVSKKVSDAKLTKDYLAVVKEFEKAQQLEAERETDFPPPVPNRVLQPSSSTTPELEISPLSNMQTALVRESNRHVIQIENEITFNEAIIEEREQGIREVQQQIDEVNEIFSDLALLVREQGGLIDDASSNIGASHSATAGATSQLNKASNIQGSTSSTNCLMLIVVAIVLLIVVFVVTG